MSVILNCSVDLISKVSLESILELVSVKVIEESAKRVVDPVSMLLSVEKSVVLSLGKAEL